jgi:hypothetical protein
MENSTKESKETTRPASRHLRIGLIIIGVAVGCVAIVLVFGGAKVLPFMPLTLLSLLVGGITVLCGLAERANRERPRLWKHIAVFLAIVLLLYLLTVGPANLLNLMNLRVVLTGGHDDLQNWALELLSEADSHMSDELGVWHVPRDRWSKQVRRLHPNSVRVYPYFENYQRGVGLLYGGGLSHLTIVVGQPDARPEPPFNDPNSLEFWSRWADGIYCLTD